MGKLSRSAGLPALEMLLQDIRYGPARAEQENPGFTAVAVLTHGARHRRGHGILALYTRCCCAPCPTPRIRIRIMAVSRFNLNGRMVSTCGPELRGLSGPEPQFSGDCEHTIDKLASVSGTSQPTRTAVASVSPNFPRSSALSRSSGGISPPATRKKAGPPFLVSYGYWRQHLGIIPPDLVPVAH